MRSRRAALRGPLSAAAGLLLDGCTGGGPALAARVPVTPLHPACPDVAPTSPELPAIPAVPDTLDALLRGAPPRSVGAPSEPLFPSFLMGGFEGSNHRRDGAHLDLTASTRHDRFAELDYRRLVSVGMRACRDDVSWPVTERRPGVYDFSRAIAMARAAERAGMTVSWNLMHYGWPEDLDIFSSAFPGRFARYARAFARTFLDEGLAKPGMVLSLVNEISFFAWAGGDVAMLNPYQRERSGPLKFQLVRAVIEAAHAVRELLPSVRLLHVDPLMHVAPRTSRRKEGETARDLHLYQYQAIDMVTGRTWETQLGGSPDLIDVIGVNYYRNNQRFLDGEFIEGNDARYRPLSALLLEVFHRYGKPILIAETGAEGDDRAPWLRYVSLEAATAMRAGCPLHALTWYPIVNHPGWVDDRHIHNGLWDYADDAGGRVRYEPLADELERCTGALNELSERCVLGRSDGAVP